MRQPEESGSSLGFLLSVNCRRLMYLFAFWIFHAPVRGGQENLNVFLNTEFHASISFQINKQLQYIGVCGFLQGILEKHKKNETKSAVLR